MHQTKGENGFMVIKIDLEKTYDRLDWNSVIDSLRVELSKWAGPPEKMCGLR